METGLVGGMAVFTTLIGVGSACLFGGVLGQDVMLWSACAWIQGAVGGLICCGSYTVVGCVQAVVAFGLMRQKKWAWFMAIGLAGLYTLSLFMPVGLALFAGLLPQKRRELYGFSG
jgi:hypothetical protein